VPTFYNNLAVLLLNSFEGIFKQPNERVAPVLYDENIFSNLLNYFYYYPHFKGPKVLGGLALYGKNLVEISRSPKTPQCIEKNTIVRATVYVKSQNKMRVLYVFFISECKIRVLYVKTRWLKKHLMSNGVPNEFTRS